MNAIPLLLVALAVFALAYRFYHGFITARLLTAAQTGELPSKKFFDGSNFYPMSKWVLFGHHFAAIAGAGPLVGPILAAQFGYFPGFAWIVVGAVMAGAVHDLVILLASIQHNGKSLAEIALTEINRPSSILSSVAILIILVVAMAGLGMVVINALADSSWATFTIAATIPIALLMGVWMFKIRPGKTTEATIAGVILLSAAVIVGRFIPGSCVAGWFTLDKTSLTTLLVLYGFAASVLPVWLLLSPRDYLSSIMKLGVIGMLALGILVVAPTLHMPAFTMFTAGGGPIIPGKLFPYLFITIACGAISGFHALVSSGTTPKMLSDKSHIRTIAVGSMLAEGIVSILALVAACSLLPLDYFIINVPADKLASVMPQLTAMGFTSSEIDSLSAQVGETIAGRTGGAVSLAVGMAKIFSSIPGMKYLMAYWYHFAIMFEALFILTTIDAGTRIGRFILQELFGKIYAPLGHMKSLWGNIAGSALMVTAWGGFIYTGSVATIWPMLGASNQLLATIALAVGTSFLINHGHKRMVWITAVPFFFVGFTTIYACVMNLWNIYIPMMITNDTLIKGVLNFSLTIIILGCALSVFAYAVPRWLKAR